jgi:hypothetical protein
VIADLDVVNARADALDNSTTLVTEDDGEGSLGVLARKGVGVADMSDRRFTYASRYLNLRVADTDAACQ